MSGTSWFDQLLTRESLWLKPRGPESDVVLSSRVRIARNLAGYPYQKKLSDLQRGEIINRFKSIHAEEPFFQNHHFVECPSLDSLDHAFLWERHLVSKEHLEDENACAVMIAENESTSVMILEEDHIRVQAFDSGLSLRKTYKKASQIDRHFSKNVGFDFREDLGYLTACPTNLGTGMRASCMLHIPALVMTKQVQKVLQALSKLNLAVRGLYGEGTQALGNFFQFSNQITLGQTEEELLDNLESVILQVTQHERDARDHLMEKKRASTEDQIHRALGILKSSHIMTSSEAISLLSLIQLGMHYGMFQKKLSQKLLNQIFLSIQPAHLQKLKGKPLETNERDIFRSTLIRDKLSKIRI